jgi:two-component system, NarL family, sensor histidine kinase YdfH
MTIPDRPLTDKTVADNKVASGKVASGTVASGTVAGSHYPFFLFIFLSLFSSLLVIVNMIDMASTRSGLAALGLPLLLPLLLMLHVGLRWYGVGWPEGERPWLGYVVGQAILLALLTLLSADPGLWLLLLVWLLGDAVGVWQQRRSIVGGLLFYTAVGVAALYMATGWETTLNWLGATLPTAAFAMVVSLLYKQQVAAREEAQELVAELAAANRQISEYAGEVERLTLAQERQRMARELHDTLAQGVAGMIMQLEATNAHLSAGRHQRAQTIVQDTMSRARTTLTEARAAIDNLRAQEEPLPFSQRLATLCADWQRETGLICDCQIEAETADCLTPIQQEHVERIVSEALTNVAKHAQATAVTLHLHQQDSQLHLTLSDDGQGFDPAAVPAQGHYGLRGLRERARLLNGTVTIEATPGQGTTIQVSLPLHLNRT